MAVIETKILNLVFPKENLMEVLDILDHSEFYHPIPSSQLAHELKDVHTLTPTRDYEDLQREAVDSAKRLHLDLNVELSPDISVDLEATKKYLNDINAQIDEIDKIKENILHDLNENKEVIEFLNKCTTKNINVEDLMNANYLTVRFGSLDNSQMDNLKYYLERPFVYDFLKKGAKETWLYYIATNKDIGEIDNIFGALNFKKIEMPKIVHGTNTDALNALNEQKNAMDEYIIHMDGKLDLIKDKETLKLQKLYATALHLDKLEHEKEYVLDLLTKYSLSGFITTNHIPAFKQLFKNINDMNFTELPTDAITDQKLEVPTETNNAGVLKDFEALSHPEAGKRDVTLGYAILCNAVFALCFGDFGLALVLLALALKKNNKMLLSLAIASFVGAFLYGQVFYYWSFTPTIIPIHVVVRLFAGLVVFVVGKFVLDACKR